MKYLTNIDLSKNELQNARIQNLAADPDNGVVGQIYYNTADKIMYQFDGTNWKPVGKQGTVTSITAGTGLSGGTITDTGTISHADTSSQSSITASSRTYINSVTLDDFGHVTALGTGTETVVDTDSYVNQASFANDDTNNNVKMTLTRTGTVTGTVTANIPKVGADSAGVLPKVTGNTNSTKIVSADYVWDATQGDYRQLPTGAFKTGTVTSITINATAPVVSSSSSAITSSGTRTISLADGYGDTKNPYAAKAANTVLAGPTSGADAAPTFRALTVDDISDIGDDYLAKSGGTMSGAINMGSNKITSLGAPTENTDAATKKYVDDAITNLPEPMIFKGTLGTGGTITSLPTAAAGNEGWTYKVITAGTYNSQAAKVGDLFICRNVSGSLYEWTYVPSGDEPSGTVTNVATGAELTGGPITSTGTIAHATSGVTAGTYPKVTVNQYGHVTGGSSLGTSDIPDLSGTYVTLAGDQTISGAKTFGEPIALQYNGDDEYVVSADYTISATGDGLLLGGPIGNEVRLGGIDYPSHEYEAANRGYVDSSVNSVTVGGAAFADDTTNNASNPVKLTITDADTITTFATANIPKVSSSSAGVVPKYAGTAIHSGDNIVASTDYLWDATTGDYRKLPSTMAPSSHTHGNIQNGGTLQTSDVAIANGDKLVITDASNSNKIARSSTTFDGSTTTQYLSKKGTFESPATSVAQNEEKPVTSGAVYTYVQGLVSGSVYKQTATNAALTADGGAFTWTISNTLGNADVSVNVYYIGTTTPTVSNGDKVIPEINIGQSSPYDITITINDPDGAGTLAANTYRAVIMG